MRCRSVPVLVLLLAYLPAACSPGFQQSHGLAADNPRSITVALPVPPDAAQQRVQAAAVAGGWTVTNAQPGVVTIGPYQLREDAQVTVTLHANIVAADSGSRVVVSGTRTDQYGMAIGRALGGEQLAATSEGEPIVQATAGRNAKSWAEVVRLADAIRAQR